MSGLVKTARYRLSPSVAGSVMDAVEALKPDASTALSKVTYDAPFHSWKSTVPPRVGIPVTVAVRVTGCVGGAGFTLETRLTVVVAGTTVSHPDTGLKS